MVTQMLLKLFSFIFGKLIGDLPPEKKAELWKGLAMLLEHAAEGGARGISEGAIEGMKKNG